MDDYLNPTPENNTPDNTTDNPTGNSFDVEAAPDSNTNYNNPYESQSNSYQGYGYPENNNQQPAHRLPNEFSPNPSYSYNNQPNNYYTPENPKKKSKAGLITFIVLITVCVVVTVISLAYAFKSSANDIITDDNSTTESTTARSNLTINDSADVLGNSEITAKVAEKIAPSVVAITVTTKDPNSYSFYGGGNSSTSAGSGFVIQSDGGYAYIATNYHVVENADLYNENTVISVAQDDGTEYEAEYVAGDSKNDIAVIKVESDNFTVAELGNSDNLVRGEFVMAIGNPLGKNLEGSVSLGIVSGTGRTVSEGSSVAFIQTDAAINSGNSGGPLVNMSGQVVGINTAKIQAEGYEGLGFSIPMSYAEPILSKLIETGKAPAYACVGIQYTFITEVISQYYNVPVGLQIASINNGSKIDTNKIKVGDIITKVDGKEITSSSDITEILNNKQPGDVINVTIYRPNSGNGSTFEATITLVSNEDLEETTTQPQNYGYGYGYGY